LLEREGTLKVLTAMQSAAQDEMAFEQRAGVVENLENFVLGHRTNVNSKVQSSKSKVQSGRVGAPRRPDAAARRPYLAFFWLLDSEF
jgi:hypothetical protein